MNRVIYCILMICDVVERQNRTVILTPFFVIAYYGGIVVRIKMTDIIKWRTIFGRIKWAGIAK